MNTSQYEEDNVALELLNYLYIVKYNNEFFHALISDLRSRDKMNDKSCSSKCNLQNVF